MPGLPLGSQASHDLTVAVLPIHHIHLTLVYRGRANNSDSSPELGRVKVLSYLRSLSAVQTFRVGPSLANSPAKFDSVILPLHFPGGTRLNRRRRNTALHSVSGQDAAKGRQYWWLNEVTWKSQFQRGLERTSRVASAGRRLVTSSYGQCLQSVSTRCLTARIGQGTEDAN